MIHTQVAVAAEHQGIIAPVAVRVDQAPSAHQAEGGGQQRLRRHIRDHFDSSSQLPPHSLYAAVSVLLAVLGGLWLWRWHKTRHERPRPFATFNHAADQMGLSLSDQWLLTRIARQQKLPTPLTLMLAAGTLQHHGEQYIQTVKPTGRRKSIATRIAAIHWLLFGSDKPRAAIAEGNAGMP